MPIKLILLIIFEINANAIRIHKANNISTSILRNAQKISCKLASR